MTDSSVSERRIRPIQDAVDSSNWKQALQQCDKWSKKGEKSDRFLALKAHVLVNQPDKTQQERGKVETVQLCRRQPAVNDIDAIYQLQDTLKQLSLETEEGPKLWERAVATKPNDKDLLLKWLHSSIIDSQWLSAQKATMAMRKAFPKDRQYDFWNVLMCFLVHQDLDLPEKDRQLFGTLGYRLITKAAELVPEDKEQMLSPGKGISTPDELYLLLKICLATGQAVDAAKFLRMEKFGIDSKIGRQEPPFVLHMMLMSLEVSGQCNETFETCEKLLSQAENKHNDYIWKVLVTSAIRSQSHDIRTRCHDLLKAASHPGSGPRYIQLAKLDFYQNTSDDQESSEALLKTCMDYVSEYGNKIFCFNDLRGPLERLDDTARTKLLEPGTEQSEDVPKQLLRFKCNYHSIEIAVDKTSELLRLAAETVKLYRRSLDTQSKVPESILLSVLALLHVYTLTHKPQYGLQAIALLESCRNQFPDYYTYTVLLMLIQANMGMMSMAMQSFDRIQVKNLQWETFGHLLLTRVSTLHPQPYHDGDHKLNPSMALDAGLRVLSNADVALTKGFRDGLGHGSYRNIIDTMVMRSDIERSLVRQIYAVEERNIRRLLASGDDTVLPVGPDKLVDKRDFAFFPLFNSKDEAVYDGIRCGPLPKGAWLDSMSVFDHCTTFLKHELASQEAIANQAFDNLVKTHALHLKSASGIAGELTPAEAENTICHDALARIVMASRGSGHPEDAAGHNKTIGTWLKTASIDNRQEFGDHQEIDTINYPTWAYIHTSLARLATLQTLSMFCAFMVKKGKGAGSNKKAAAGPVIDKSTLSDWQTQIANIEKKIHNDAKELKKAINESGVLGTLVDIVMGRKANLTAEGFDIDFEAMYNEPEVETLCGRIKESWEDALDGILAVKVKQYK